jgi:hypothetical protein
MASYPDIDSAEVIYEPGVHSEWVLRTKSFDAGCESCAHAVGFDQPVAATTMLELEQIMADRVAESNVSIARVVHTFGGRDVYFRDGSRIEFRWQLLVCDWRCLDCGVDTDAIAEYYMVHDSIWEQAHPDLRGQLCIGCLELRLGRTLLASDFTDQSINTNPEFKRSPRLISRRTDLLGPGQ